MSVPQWLQSILQEFGNSIGVEALEFSPQDTVALNFQTGATLHLEYAGNGLMVAMSVPCSDFPDSMKIVLGYSHYAYRNPFRLRSAYDESSGRAWFTVKFPHSEISMPNLNESFRFLWRIAEELQSRQ